MFGVMNGWLVVFASLFGTFLQLPYSPPPFRSWYS